MNTRTSTRRANTFFDRIADDSQAEQVRHLTRYLQQSKNLLALYPDKPQQATRREIKACEKLLSELGAQEVAA